MSRYSIIVTTMGRPELLLGFLRSVQETGSRPYQVCIAFDPDGDLSCSSGGFSTKAAVEDVRWVVAPKPGMSAATNAAFSLSDRDWIVWLNDDHICLPGWDDFEPEIREDRILCFSALSHTPGSFPPVVDAGNTPANFRYNEAVRVSQTLQEQYPRGVTLGNFHNTGVFHRSRWVPWATWPDPYSCNDISWFWDLYQTHPDLLFGWMRGRCVYHFGMGSIRYFPEKARNPWDEFIQYYGIDIGEAWRRIYQRSEALWIAS